MNTNLDIPTRLAGAKRPDGSFVFPDDTEIRVSCPGIEWDSPENDYGYGDMKGVCLAAILSSGYDGAKCVCQGRRWTASKDLAVWLVAADKAKIVMDIGNSDCDGDASGTWDVEIWTQHILTCNADPTIAVLDALLTAVQASGAEVPA